MQTAWDTVRQGMVRQFVHFTWLTETKRIQTDSQTERGIRLRWMHADGERGQLHVDIHKYRIFIHLLWITAALTRSSDCITLIRGHGLCNILSFSMCWPLTHSEMQSRGKTNDWWWYVLIFNFSLSLRLRYITWMGLGHSTPDISPGIDEKTLLK